MDTFFSLGTCHYNIGSVFIAFCNTFHTRPRRNKAEGVSRHHRHCRCIVYSPPENRKCANPRL